MRLKILVLVAALLAGISLAKPTSTFAQDDLTKHLAAIEQSLWEAWADAEPTPFERHLTVDHLNIGGWGIVAGRQAVVDVVAAAACDVTRFELDDWQAVRLSDDTAILTFEAEQEAVCGGVPSASEVVVSSVYVLRDGTWLNAMYHETPISDDD